MTFNKIKQYLATKKQKENSWFVVELNNEYDCYIVSQQMLEIMLADNVSLQYMINCNFSGSFGRHLGNDQKSYQRYRLNDNGWLLYDSLKLQDRGKVYVEALEEMNADNIFPEKLAEEKAEIRWNFKRHQVKSIKSYNAAELKQSDNISLAL